MIWPFTSNALLRRDVQLLQARLRDLEQRLLEEKGYTKYFRERYERLADATLQHQGVSVTPVHVDTPAAKPPLGARVMQIASVVGNHAGVDFTRRAAHATSHADLPAVR